MTENRDFVILNFDDYSVTTDICMYEIRYNYDDHIEFLKFRENANRKIKENGPFLREIVNLLPVIITQSFRKVDYETEFYLKKNMDDLMGNYYDLVHEIKLHGFTDSPIYFSKKIDPRLVEKFHKLVCEYFMKFKFDNILKFIYFTSTNKYYIKKDIQNIYEQCSGKDRLMMIDLGKKVFYDGLRSKHSGLSKIFMNKRFSRHATIHKAAVNPYFLATLQFL